MTNIISIDKKFCGQCGKTKLLTEFSKNSREKDGVQTYCKPCSSGNSIRSRKRQQKLIKLDLSEMKKNQITEAKNIINIISQYFDVSVEQLKTKTKVRKILRPRMMCYYFFDTKNIGLRHSEMTKIFNQKQHGTVINAINFMTNQYNLSRDIKYDIDRISELLDKYIYSPMEK